MQLMNTPVKHDVGGKSLSGWTKSLQRHGQSDDAGAAAVALTNEYFRPRTPHMDRRIEAAERCVTWMQKPQEIKRMSPNPYNRTDMSPNPY